MVVTNEPGYYSPGKYGIRIENILAVQKFNDEFLCFEVLTQLPYCKNLINWDLFNSEFSNQRKTLDKYYAHLADKVLPLHTSETGRKWFENELNI